MTKYIEQLSKLAFLTLTGVIGSVVVGLMVYGNEVFGMTHIGFSFVSFGLSGAFIFAFYHVRGLSETITAAVVTSALQFAVASSWITPLNAAIWSFGVNLPLILVALIFERKLSPFRQYKFVVVALLYGVMFVLLTMFVSLLSGMQMLPPTVFRQNFVDGALIGLGLALGIEAGEALIHSLEHHQSLKHHGHIEKHA
ncbi:MAG: hypothetical protein ACKVRP_03655 [Bacteroidota bacterium]